MLCLVLTGLAGGSLLAQQGGGEVMEPWARFLLLLVLQGGALAILAYLALRTLPEMLAKLAAMRTEDLNRFDARTKELAAEFHEMHQNTLKVMTRCLDLIMAVKTETQESINQVIAGLPKRPQLPEGR